MEFIPTHEKRKGEDAFRACCVGFSAKFEEDKKLGLIFFREAEMKISIRRDQIT